MHTTDQIQNTTHNAGVPPAPPEAHQEASVKAPCHADSALDEVISKLERQWGSRYFASRTDIQISHAPRQACAPRRTGYASTTTDHKLGKILAAAREVISRITATSDCPVDGLVVYSERLGKHPRYFYTHEIRLLPSGTYSYVLIHSSGHRCPDETGFTRIEDVARRFLQMKRGYQGCEGR